MSTHSKWLVTVLSVSLAALAWAAAGPGFHVAKTYKLGGEVAGIISALTPMPAGSTSREART